MFLRKRSPALKVLVEVIRGEFSEFIFDKPFRIGRQKDCELHVDNAYVSRVHAEVYFEKGCWIIRDLESANGLFVASDRLERVEVAGPTTVRLGVDGPTLKCEEVARCAPGMPMAQTGADPALAPYLAHYFSKPDVNEGGEPAGERTVLIRRAFAQVETHRRRRFLTVISILGAAIVLAGLYGFEQHRQLKEQRNSAENLFYTIKAQDLVVANLQKRLSREKVSSDHEELELLHDRRQTMEDNYNQYLSTLHIYDPKLSEQERIVLRVARIFGECEVDMPKDFQAEMRRYIDKWRSTGRLKTAIQIARQKGYTRIISRELVAKGLPPQFFYLALQESDFNPYAVGSPTRRGYAKGMWQFIPETAVKYGLRLGPLVDLPRTDVGDDRHDYQKETSAAALYLQDLYTTDAQASGFLVMACYNWGEGQVLPLVRSMPANPRDRNFWKLLMKHRNRIPPETYDYVFSIASAAAIGENPKLFGFDFDNPLAEPARP